MGRLACVNKHSSNILSINACVEIFSMTDSSGAVKTMRRRVNGRCFKGVPEYRVLIIREGIWKDVTLDIRDKLVTPSNSKALIR